MPRDEIAILKVGGNEYQGWESISVTRELNAAASNFELKLTDRWEQGQEPWRIKPGDFLSISMGGLRVLTGYVDKFEASISASSRELSVSGRSRTCDIVDCSVIGDLEFSGLTLKDLAEKLCKPFNILVKYREAAGNALDKITAQQGDTVFSLLEKHMKQRKVLAYPSVYGDLIIEGRGKIRAASAIVQGKNLISGSVSWDNTNRFSEYTVKGQNLGFLGDAKQAVVSTGKSFDKGVTRYRPHVFVVEATASDEGTFDRAKYECELRAAQAIELEVVVPGWYMENDELWEVNRIVPVDIGYLGIRRNMLSKKVTFTKDQSGTKTSLTLIREDAFGFDQSKKKEDGLGWVKALNPQNSGDKQGAVK